MANGTSNSPQVGLKAAALFEALKGLLVILAGLGLLAFVRHYPRIFIEAAGRLTDARIWLFATGALAYSALRFAEAYGLWRARPWAEWIGIVSGCVYLPVEVVALVRRPTILKAILLVLNALLVAYLSVIRYRQSRELRQRIQSN